MSDSVRQSGDGTVVARSDCLGFDQHGLRETLRCSPVDPLEPYCFVDDTAWAAFEEV